MRRVFLHSFISLTGAVALSVSGVFAQGSVTKIQPSQLVTNGESFFEASNITSELTRLARADGFIGANESFKTIAKSGQPLATIIEQYKNCNPKPTYLISDGGGIDLMSSSDITGLSNKLKQYLEEMRKGGTKKLLWMIYPDPQAPLGSAQLKSGQDLWAKAVPPIINGCTDPKTLLVDLRTVWAGKYSQYTSDGIHCTNAGGTATAEAFWKAMKDSNFFDLAVYAEPLTIAKKSPTTFFGMATGNGFVTVNLALEAPAPVMMQLTNVAGRTVFMSTQQLSSTGRQQAVFPVGALAPGMYCCELKAGTLTNNSTLIVK